uniref:ABC transmembrane type-1 domain-containing protein n=1 Tax=Steinernema glaseri TaxID=37863 RepID=A0A1I8AJW5_9BILA
MANQTTVFCVDEFWNENIFDGNISGIPVFTDCFQHTALVAIPCFFFWLLLPILLVQLRISNGPVLPWTNVMSIKSGLTVILICDRLFVIIWAIAQSFLDDHIEPVVNFVYPCVQLVTLIGLWLAKNECRRKGIRSSGVLFCTWLLFAVMGIPEFYAWIKLGTEPQTTAELDTARYVAYLVWYPICLLQLLAFCWSDPTGWKSKYNDPDQPEESASFLNRQSFWWFNSMVALGRRKPLEVNDLFKIKEEMTAKVMDEEWERMWQQAMVDFRAQQKEYKNSNAYVSLVNAKTPLLAGKKNSYGSTMNVNAPPQGEKPEPPSIVWRLFLLCKWDFLGGTFVKIWSDVLQFANPILLNQLISFTEDPNAPWWKGMSFALGIFLASELRSIFLNNYFYCMFRAGVRIQSILTSAVYRKMITPQVQQYWSSPFQIILALVLLWQTVGAAAFSGVAIMILVIPVNFTISIIVKKWQVQQMRLKDERVKITNEVLNGIKVSILTSAVYRKTLKLSNSARKEKTVGEIVNLMAIDVERFQMITPQVQQYWSSPFQIILALVLLWQTVGAAAFSGVAIMILVIPVNFTISIIVKKWQVQQMRLKDERVKITNEVLNGIKVVKLYAWEPPMLAEIDKIRRKEVALIRRSVMTRAITDILNVASPFLVALLTFTTYLLMDSKNALTPQIAFVSLTLFNQLRSPMMMVAELIGQTVQAMVSNKRLKEFFVADELDENAIDKEESND